MVTHVKELAHIKELLNRWRHHAIVRPSNFIFRATRYSHCERRYLYNIRRAFIVTQYMDGLNLAGWWNTFMNMDMIIEMCDKGSLRWTNHVLVRLLQRGVTTDDVVCALQNGEIIEQYPTDYPYPSCLVLGVLLHKQYIHAVCGM